RQSWRVTMQTFQGAGVGAPARPLLRRPRKLPVAPPAPPAIPARPAVIVPLLAMPPKNEPTPWTSTPDRSAVIEPVLVIPPPALAEPNTETADTRMPAPRPKRRAGTP